MTKAEVEKIIAGMLESRLQQAIEEFLGRNELRAKELALIERVVRVEEELKSLRQMLEVKFDASEKRFEALQREMNARFEAMNERFVAMDERFVSMDKRFESLQSEITARFEAVDKRFSTIQWMIGIFVGVPAFIIALVNVLKALS
jgi:DNA anti-recombination protein RmuC